MKVVYQCLSVPLQTFNNQLNGLMTENAVVKVGTVCTEYVSTSV